MESNKNISIIIPIYNAESTIEECLMSILKDNRQDIEVIAIVDGSVDNSLNICKKISKKDNRLKVIYQENQGIFLARQNGIKNSTGKYIMFVDSDDYMINNSLEKMREMIKKYSPDLIRFRYMKNNGDYEQYKYFEEKEKYIKKEELLEEIYPMFISGYMLNAMWTNCIKREYSENINIDKYKNVLYGEDLMYNLEIFSNIQNAVFLEDVLYRYNTNENSITRTREIKRLLKNLEDCITIYTSLYTYLEKWNMLDSKNILKVQERIQKEASSIINLIKEKNVE